MSAVAMYFDKESKTLYAANDGITISGYSLTATDAIKLHKGNKCIIGSCGSTFLGQFFPRHFTKLVDACVKKSKNAVHFGELITDNLAGTEEWNKVSMITQNRSPRSSVVMLIGCRYGLYVAAAPQYDFARITEPYSAIGAGESFSKGSLSSWLESESKANPEQAVKAAVAAACRGSIAVTGKIRMEKLKV